MPITRMDLMTMAPKTNEATSYKVNENQKPIVEQTVIHDQIDKKIQHDRQQTVKKANADNPEYRYDAKEKGNNQYSRQQKKNSKQNQEEKEKNNKYGYIGNGHIDVSI